MSDTDNVVEIIHNREAWLMAFAREIAPYVRQRSGVVLANYRASCGFPSRGGRGKKRTIGECWNITDHKHREIFIHPQMADSYEVGGVLVHELIHAGLAPGTGHRKPFSQAAKKVGLISRPKPGQPEDLEQLGAPITANLPGKELRKVFKGIIDRIGEYPHDALPVGWGGVGEKGRQLKVACPICGYTARTTQKWLDEAGTPVCPTCDVPMEEAGPGPLQHDEGDLVITALEQSVEYTVPPLPDLKRRLAEMKISISSDPRWTLRMHRRGRNVRWTIIDYGATIDPSTGRTIYGGPPRITPAESRQDAMDLLVALRDGSMTYADLEVDDNDESLDADWFDDSPDHLAEDEDETPDYPEDMLSDPRFQFEIDRGIKPEDIDPELERTRREGWVK